MSTRKAVWISIGAGLVAGMLIHQMIHEDKYDYHPPAKPPCDGPDCR